ncbi:unnamed protein product [Moneuplotes crassus]|uniref:Uncharacterized protein n=1 Tax=Euplotes crassus TaxID=5936 RepID=A0AAD1UDG5_EUPCR|nr:unnamed protein product [Moneuplotes crassus]
MDQQKKQDPNIAIKDSDMSNEEESKDKLKAIMKSASSKEIDSFSQDNPSSNACVKDEISANVDHSSTSPVKQELENTLQNICNMLQMKTSHEEIKEKVEDFIDKMKEVESIRESQLPVTPSPPSSSYKDSESCGLSSRPSDVFRIDSDINIKTGKSSEEFTSEMDSTFKNPSRSQKLGGSGHPQSSNNTPVKIHQEKNQEYSEVLGELIDEIKNCEDSGLKCPTPMNTSDKSSSQIQPQEQEPNFENCNENTGNLQDSTLVGIINQIDKDRIRDIEKRRPKNATSGGQKLVMTLLTVCCILLLYLVISSRMTPVTQNLVSKEIGKTVCDTSHYQSTLDFLVEQNLNMSTKVTTYFV